MAIQLRGSSMPNDISPIFDNFQPHARLSLHTFESISKVQFSDFTVILTSVSSWLIKQLNSPFRNECITNLEAPRPCFRAHVRSLLRGLRHGRSTPLGPGAMRALQAYEASGPEGPNKAKFGTVKKSPMSYKQRNTWNTWNGEEISNVLESRRSPDFPMSAARIVGRAPRYSTNSNQSR